MLYTECRIWFHHMLRETISSNILIFFIFWCKIYLVFVRIEKFYIHLFHNSLWKPEKSSLPFKNKKYFTLENLLIYVWFVGRYFSGLYKFFQKNSAILVKTLGKEKKLLKFVFGYLNTKKILKNPIAIKLNPRGGGVGKALITRTLRKNFFCGFPYVYNENNKRENLWNRM